MNKPELGAKAEHVSGAENCRGVGWGHSRGARDVAIKQMLAGLPDSLPIVVATLDDPCKCDCCAETRHMKTDQMTDNKTQCLRAREYYLAMKRNEALYILQPG